MKKHKKEPWTEDMFGTQPFSNYKQVSKEDFERSMICVNACAGITTEALENGLINHLLSDAFMRTLNPFTLFPQRKKDMTFLGRPIYEDSFEGE
jgi:hypothetical protein